MSKAIPIRESASDNERTREEGRDTNTGRTQKEWWKRKRNAFCPLFSQLFFGPFHFALHSTPVFPLTRQIAHNVPAWRRARRSLGTERGKDKENEREKKRTQEKANWFNPVEEIYIVYILSARCLYTVHIGCLVKITLSPTCSTFLCCFPLFFLSSFPSFLLLLLLLPN